MGTRATGRAGGNAWSVLVALLALSLFGCSASGPTPSSPQPQVSVPQERWEVILADLAERGVDASSAKAVRAEAVTWNDGSLGCPEPGKTYTQALVEGYQVIVQVGSQQFDYHFGDGQSLLLCE